MDGAQGTGSGEETLGRRNALPWAVQNASEPVPGHPMDRLDWKPGAPARSAAYRGTVGYGPPGRAPRTRTQPRPPPGQAAAGIMRPGAAPRSSRRGAPMSAGACRDGNGAALLGADRYPDPENRGCLGRRRGARRSYDAPARSAWRPGKPACRGARAERGAAGPERSGREEKQRKKEAAGPGHWVLTPSYRALQ